MSLVPNIKRIEKSPLQTGLAPHVAEKWAEREPQAPVKAQNDKTDSKS